MEEYAILGGGGMALELADFMLSEDKKICGYYSPEEDKLLNSMIPYLGDERKNFEPKLLYIIASGLIHIRQKMINFIEANDLQAGSFVSKNSQVSKTASIGKGAVIFPFVLVNTFVTLGNYVFVNFHSCIGHNAIVGANSVIGPGARVTGNCKIGNNVALGSNAALVPGSVLEDESEIGILTYPPRKVKAGHFILSEPGRILR